MWIARIARVARIALRPRLLLLTCVAVTALLPVARPAFGGQEALDGVIAAVVLRRYEQIHACYRRALAVDRERGGTVFLRATLGRGDRVASVRVERDELEDPRTASCLVAEVGRWTLQGALAAGVDSGSDVVLPLTFRALPGQYVVWRADVPARAIEDRGPAIASRPAGVVQALLTERNVGARRLTLSGVTVQPRGLVSLPAGPPADGVLYVLAGSGQLEAAFGTRRYARHGRLVPGRGAWIPPGWRARVHAGQGGRLDLLWFVLPVTGGVAPGSRRARPLLSPQGRGFSGRGTVRARPLLARGEMGHERFYLGVLRVRPSAVAPARAHLGAEALFVLAGRGSSAVEGRRTEVGPAQALFIPPGAIHSFVAGEGRSLVAVQLFAPAGPEQRVLR